MDLTSFITKIFEGHQKIKAAQSVSPGFGMVLKRYDTKAGSALLLVILSPPKKRAKGKKKDYDKIFHKSIQQGKTFSSKDFSIIQQHLSSNFSSIITPQNQILEKMQTVLAGLLLGFVPIQNVKYSMTPGEKNYVVYNTVQDGQYAFLVNIVGLKDDGLYLAHENQMFYIKQEIHSGKNPNLVHNIPILQTGSDSVPTSQNIPSQTTDRASDHQAIKKFRQHMQQKKDGVQVKEELDYETVIDFASRQNPDSQSNQYPANGGTPSRPAPLPHPKAVAIPPPQIIPDAFSGLHPPRNVQPPDTTSEKRDVEGELDQLQTQLSLVTDTLTQQLTKKDEDINKYQEKIKQMQEDLDKTANSTRQITQENLKLQAKIQESEDRITKLKGVNDDLVRTVQKLKQETGSLAAQLQEAAQEADQRYHQMMDEKLNLEIIATELQEELADLRRNREKNTES